MLIIREIIYCEEKLQDYTASNVFELVTYSIYAYLFVDFSEDKYHNFVQNMGIVHHRFE